MDIGGYARFFVLRFVTKYADLEQIKSLEFMS